MNGQDLAAPALLLLLTVAFGIIAAVRLHSQRAAGEIYRRGARIRRRRAGCMLRVRRAAPGTLQLGRVAIRPEDESKHFKFIGTTGTGKSTAIRALLAAALERGDRAVITDPDGGYLRRFYDRYRGDRILNPFEAQSDRWDLFGEIDRPFDVEQLAGALIPTTEDAATREWRSYARTFFTAVTRACHLNGRRDLAQLWRLLAIAPSEELRPLIAGTPAQPFLEPDNARMFGSIRSVLASAVAALEFIQVQRAVSLSVREWVRHGRGVLFMPYRATQIAALRAIISVWMRLAIFEAMNGAEEVDQRLWFVIDELDALGAVDGLKDALARLRKFGGRCVLGFQSIAQVSSTYGAGEAQTIVENCGNTLILRCSGSEHGGTSHFASRLIGERELLRRQRTRGRDREGAFAKGSRRSTQVSEQIVTEVAVMPSQLEQLPDLHGYLKTASSRSWTAVSLEH